MYNYKNQREEFINNLILISRNNIINRGNQLYFDNKINKKLKSQISDNKLLQIEHKSHKRKYFNYYHYTSYPFYNNSSN